MIDILTDRHTMKQYVPVFPFWLKNQTRLSKMSQRVHIYDEISVQYANSCRVNDISRITFCTLPVKVRFELTQDNIKRLKKVEIVQRLVSSIVPTMWRCD